MNSRCLHAGGHEFNAEWLREAYIRVVALDLAGTAQASEPGAQNERGPYSRGGRKNFWLAVAQSYQSDAIEMI